MRAAQWRRPQRHQRPPEATLCPTSTEVALRLHPTSGRLPFSYRVPKPSRLTHVKVCCAAVAGMTQMPVSTVAQSISHRSESGRIEVNATSGSRYALGSSAPPPATIQLVPQHHCPWPLPHAAWRHFRRFDRNCSCRDPDAHHILLVGVARSPLGDVCRPGSDPVRILPQSRSRRWSHHQQSAVISETE